MNYKKYLVIGLIIAIVFGLGCIDDTSPKSGVNNDEQIISAPIKESTTVMPTVMITDIKTPIQTTSVPTVTTTVTQILTTPIKESTTVMPTVMITDIKTPIQTTSVPTVTTTVTQILTTNSSDRYVTVTKIVDGDTIWIDNNEKVRFVGINTPEIGQSGSYDATQYVSNRILNKRIYLDVDDKNLKDNYDRTLAMININGDNLNQELLCKGYAEIMYIPPSEFDPYSWKSSCPIVTPTQTQTSTPTQTQTSTPTQTQTSTPTQTQTSTPTQTQTSTPTPTTPASCDSSYPDFCIPPPPPDLNCDDIPQKNFKVLQPDPHRFDRDKDGIGCEVQ